MPRSTNPLVVGNWKMNGLAAALDEALLRPGLSVVVRVDTRTGPADKPAR